MAFKMKGFNPGKGTGMSSAFEKALVGNQKNLPEHLKKKIEAAPESPMKDIKKSIKGKYSSAKDENHNMRHRNPQATGGYIDDNHTVKKKKSAMKKMDPPATQAKIKKMIVAGIEKGMDDRDIMKKIRSMTDGSKEYTYNRKTKEVRVYPKGRSGFEGELETDPDKG